MSDKNWIQKAIKKPGSLRKSLGVKKGQKIPASKLNKAAKKGGKVKKKKGKFPDLTGDGKVTRADVLKGRGVFKSGGIAKRGRGCEIR